MKISAFDRFLVSVFPTWGLKRLRALTSASQLSRHYEAAAAGRRTSGWARTAGNADVINAVAMTEIRMHARDLLRNNGNARRGQHIVANNTAGWGIMPKAIGPDAKQNAAANSIWKDWASSTVCEVEGRHTFAAIQHLAMRTIVSDGEVLIRRRLRQEKDNLALPMQLQVLEADYLDMGRNSIGGPFDSGAYSGGPVINGVEFDLIGRRAAYWLFSQHPGSGRNFGPSKRVPASEVLHIAYTDRPGQTRGISWLGSAIVTMKDLDEYEDAELVKQKIAAAFSAFVTDDGMGSNPAAGEQSTLDPLVENFEPGMIARLPPGKQITFAQPPQMTSDQLPIRSLRKIAAGLGITYEDLTGDYSQVNFSSARMARLAHYGNVCDWQENMLIPLLCQATWGWVMEVAQMTGMLGASDTVPSATWTVPPIPMIEPDKEGLAKQRLVRAGAMTFSGMVREQGYDFDDFIAEYKADLVKLDAAGIKLDSDARNLTSAGQEQPSATAEAAPPAPAPVPPKPREADPVVTVDIDVSDFEALQ